MEGGLMPWKVQTVMNNSPTLESYEKPLPPPPIGYIWVKNKVGEWELKNVQTESRSIIADDKSAIENTVIEHIVMPNDTLQGICLRYRVSVVDIRRNNNFSGNSFKSQKVLKIPLQQGAIVNAQDDSDPDVILQIFKNRTGEDTKESRFYLEENGWKLNEAISEWEHDEKFSNSKKKLSSQATATSFSFQEMDKYSKNMILMPVLSSENLQNQSTTPKGFRGKIYQGLFGNDKSSQKQNIFDVYENNLEAPLLSSNPIKML